MAGQVSGEMKTILQVGGVPHMNTDSGRFPQEWGTIRCSGVRATCLAIALVLTGCMVGPDFEQPAVASSPKWLEADDQRLKIRASDHRTWWKVFRDPVLNRLVEGAYRNNLPLHLAGVRVLEARAQLGFAIGEFFPQVQQAVGALQYNRLSQTSVPGALFHLGGYSYNQLGLTATWEIDFWGKFRRAIESADAGLLASIADYDNTLISLTGDVASVYVLIRTLEKRLAIARQNTKIQDQSVQIAQAQFEYGTTSRRDVKQAQTILASTQGTIPSLEASLRQAKNALCVLLGMPPRDLTSLLAGSAGIPAPPPQVIVGIPADLLRRRPDIRRAEMQAAAESARIGVAKAALYPAFSLTGSFGFQASDVASFSLGDLFQRHSTSGHFGPAVQWNILNYGQITNVVRAQDARFQESVIAYQNAVLRAQQEVEDRLIGFLRAQDRAKFLGESAAAAMESLDLAVLQYQIGLADFTTVLTAQQALLTEQDNLATTLGDVSGNLVGLYRALGGGWQIRAGSDFLPRSLKARMATRTDWGKLLDPTSSVLEFTLPKNLVRPPEW